MFIEEKKSLKIKLWYMC